MNVRSHANILPLTSTRKSGINKSNCLQLWLFLMFGFYLMITEETTAITRYSFPTLNPTKRNINPVVDFSSKSLEKLKKLQMQIKEHITLRNFSLQSSDVGAFVTCKCKLPTIYLIWRVFWSVYHCAWLAGNLVMSSLQDDPCVFKWFIYLSNWMYVILTIECLIEAAVVIGTWGRRPDEYQDSNLPWYIQIMWLLYTISVVGAVMVSVWYWTLIYKGKPLTAIRLNTHAVAAIYVVLNMVVTRLPLRLLHFLYPVAFGVTYTLFSAIYYGLGGTNQTGDTFIYSILDWSRPGRTLVITSLSNFVLIPVVHVTMWALSKCFQRVHDRFRKHRVVYSQGLDNVNGEGVDIS